MILICAKCHRRWTLKRNQRRSDTCPRCRTAAKRAGAKKGWHHRRALAAVRAPVPDDGGVLAVSLDQLMREADAAGAKALAAIVAVTGQLPAKKR